MRLLLDTHAFLWWVDGGTRVSVRARRAIANPANDCLLSIVSVWEMAIKVSLGKLRLPTSPERFVADQLAANHFNVLTCDLHHVCRLANLPFRHRDPFDRLLVSQALSDSLRIVSADPIFQKYGVKRLW